MRGPLCLLLVILAPAARAQSGLPPRPPLRYDGIYESQAVEWIAAGRDSVRVWTYLRFTPDGMVVHFVTTGRADQLGSFSLGNRMLPIGSVAVRDGRVWFSVSNYDGVLVDHEGRAEGGRLYLHSHSRFNGHRADRAFVFLPLPASRLREWDGLPPD